MHPEDLQNEFSGPCNFHPKGCVESMVTNYAIAKRLGLGIKDLAQVPDDHSVWSVVGFYLA